MKAGAKKQSLKKTIVQILGKDNTRLSEQFGEITLSLPSERIVEVLMKLRDDPATAMTQLMDICGVDYPQRPRRFEIVYHLLSLPHNGRLRVKVETDENTPVSSVVSVYSAAGWFEREVWDLYGVKFTAHPDLRRILTDYDFEGHPLRKDFPLSGHVQARYDNEKQRVAYEPVKLTQEYREYDFPHPWKGET